MEKNVNLKLVVLGEGEVGKTSIINAFLGKDIPTRYLPTIGNKTSRKGYVLKKKETVITLNIWDTGGQSFNVLNPVYFRNVDIAIIVFDLTRPKETLNNIKKEFIDKVKYYSEESLTIIVGNKLDLFSVDDKFGETISNFLDTRDNFIFLSAKSGENVKDCFELLLYTFLKKAEILTPDIITENTAEEFIQVLGKNEKTLKKNLLKIGTINSFLKKLEVKPPIKTKSQEKEEKSELKYQDFIKQELQKVEYQKNEVLDKFLITITELEKSLTHIKKSHIKSVDDVIKNLKDLFLISAKESQEYYELVQRLNREENELIIIVNKKEDEKQELMTEDSIIQSNAQNIN